MAVNPHKQEIELETLADNSCDDAGQVDLVLDQMHIKTKASYGDGGYDSTAASC